MMVEASAALQQGYNASQLSISLRLIFLALFYLHLTYQIGSLPSSVRDLKVASLRLSWAENLSMSRNLTESHLPGIS
ncbi:hypothetical protein HD806DRAFT_490395 [Xylariaceae sp. AK1471]|nr:hypothetical protein HD806DRAFT_490395 [Xylariaceae sp. AK1471]